MTGESPLTLARTRVPNLHHAVFAARDEAQVVSSQSPDTFDVTEESTDAGLSTRRVGVCERVCGKNDEGVGSVISLLVVVVGLLMLVGLGSVSVP